MFRVGISRWLRFRDRYSRWDGERSPGCADGGDDATKQKEWGEFHFSLYRFESDAMPEETGNRPENSSNRRKYETRIIHRKRRRENRDVF